MSFFSCVFIIFCIFSCLLPSLWNVLTFTNIMYDFKNKLCLSQIFFLIVIKNAAFMLLSRMWTAKLFFYHSFLISLRIILKPLCCPNFKLQMLKKKCGWVSGTKTYQPCSNGQIIQLWILHIGIRMNQKFLLTSLLTACHIQAR